MASQPETKKPSAASRYLFLFLIGLVVGAICTVMAMRALQARQDPFPDSVMQVMAKHSGQLADKVKQNRCAATDTIPHVRTLRARRAREQRPDGRDGDEPAGRRIDGEALGALVRGGDELAEGGRDTGRRST